MVKRKFYKQKRQEGDILKQKSPLHDFMYGFTKEGKQSKKISGLTEKKLYKTGKVGLTPKQYEGLTKDEKSAIGKGITQYESSKKFPIFSEFAKPFTKAVTKQQYKSKGYETSYPPVREEIRKEAERKASTFASRVGAVTMSLARQPKQLVIRRKVGKMRRMYGSHRNLYNEGRGNLYAR